MAYRKFGLEYHEIVEFLDKKGCFNCEMNMGGVCAGSNYGEFIEDMNNFCDCWECDINTFLQLCEKYN